MTHILQICKKCKKEYYYQASGYGSFDEINDDKYCPECKQKIIDSCWYKFKDWLEWRWLDVKSIFPRFEREEKEEPISKDEPYLGLRKYSDGSFFHKAKPPKLVHHSELGVQPLDPNYKYNFISDIKVEYKSDKNE